MTKILGWAPKLKMIEDIGNDLVMAQKYPGFEYTDEQILIRIDSIKVSDLNSEEKVKLIKSLF